MPRRLETHLHARIARQRWPRPPRPSTAHRDRPPPARRCCAACVAGGDARAHGRRGFRRRRAVRRLRGRDGRRNHVIRVTAIEGSPVTLSPPPRLRRRNLQVAASVAMTAYVRHVPSHTNARLPGCHVGHALAHGVRRADDFDARARARYSGRSQRPFLHQRIAMADAAGLDFDPRPARGRATEISRSTISKRPPGPGDLSSAHF